MISPYNRACLSTIYHHHPLYLSLFSLSAFSNINKTQLPILTISRHPNRHPSHPNTHTHTSSLSLSLSLSLYIYIYIYMYTHTHITDFCQYNSLQLDSIFSFRSLKQKTASLNKKKSI